MMGIFKDILKKRKESPKKEEATKNIKNLASKNKKRASKATAPKVKKKAPKISKRKNSLGEYFKTNISGFDSLIEPGIPRGSSVLIEGGPGSGKTLWCLTLLKEMCKRGKKVLYMSFEEPEERLASHLKGFGIDVEEYTKKGLLYIKRFNSLDISRSVEALLSEAKKELLIDVQAVLIPKEFEADIVIMDSLSSIASAFSGESNRFRVYMEQLFRYLEEHKISSFLIREVASPTHIGGSFLEKEEAVSFLSDGIIAIYNVLTGTGERKRAIEIIKMRGANIKRKVCEFQITSKGVKIYPKKVLKGKYKLS